MASPADFEKAGIYLLFFLFSLIAAIIGFIKGAKCGNWYCSYIFIGIALFLLISAAQKMFS